ncbi:MAG: ferredoxin oxidoreductase [Thermoprotei archaeon]|nr:MAG: ferredoxin oxidoreductase [Thermoprotei archaeon]
MVKWKRLPLNSNYAVAYAVKDADVDVIAAYPITPQTTIVEKIAEFLANGEFDAEMIHVESEHSALSALVGASAAGARVFTATASQGLELMHEILHIASGSRLPIVMAIATRALSAPISIWCDYSDLMNTRDASWITFINSSAQEVYDTLIMAYKIAEDPRVLLPVMSAHDGYIMSHTVEPVDVAEDPEDIRRFIPKRRDRINILDPDRPVSIGTIVRPEWFYEVKYQQVVAMREARKVIKEAQEEFASRFGRRHDVIETHMMDDAELAILTYGGIYGTAREAVDMMRAKGMKVGSVKLRLWRPFPADELRKALSNVQAVAVVDRAISYGTPIAGPVALEVISLFYDEKDAPKVISFVAGIGQRTVTEYDFVGIAEKSLKYLSSGSIPKETIYWGVRGVEV